MIAKPHLNVYNKEASAVRSGGRKGIRFAGIVGKFDLNCAILPAADNSTDLAPTETVFRNVLGHSNRIQDFDFIVHFHFIYKTTRQAGNRVALINDPGSSNHG